MKEKQEIYQFTLILKDVDENTSNLEDSLFKAGCSDALINFRNETVYLDFNRTANSREEAIRSAIQDVASGGIVATQEI
jgi:hypothetical protein